MTNSRPARTALIAVPPLTVTRPARDTFTESRLVKQSEKKKQSSGRFCLKGMKHTIPYLTILSDRRPLSAAQDTDAQKI